MNENKIEVSVICAAFNHEKFISDTLDSIVNQITSFNIEIIVHDDVSTDKTREIIDYYAKRYHNIVKIYEKDNQFKHGVSILDLMTRKARGKYVAICECDDYWTDNKKLQTQYNFMENNPNCTLCCHSGYIVNNKKIKIGSFESSHSSKIFNTNDIIEKWICPTASIMFVRDVYLNSSFPTFKEMKAPCGDYPLIINMSLYGDIYYINKKMCAYRKNDKSVSSKWNKNRQNLLDVNNRFIKMLDFINEYTNGKYYISINNIKKSKQFNNLLIQGEFRKAKTNEFKDFYKKNKKEFYYYWLYLKFPKIFKIYEKIKLFIMNIGRKKIYPVK